MTFLSLIHTVSKRQFAIKHAMTGRPGPSCVVMRNRAITGEIDAERIPKIYPTSGYLRESLSTPPVEDIEKASHLL